MEQPTGGQEKQLESQRNQAVIQTRQLDWQASVHKDTQAFVHGQLSILWSVMAQSFFWSKIISPRRGPADWHVFFSGQIETAIHQGWDMCVCVLRMALLIKGTPDQNCVKLVWLIMRLGSKNYSWDENTRVQLYLLLDCVDNTEEDKYIVAFQYWTQLLIIWVLDCWYDRKAILKTLPWLSGNFDGHF